MAGAAVVRVVVVRVAVAPRAVETLVAFAVAEALVAVEAAEEEMAGVVGARAAVDGRVAVATATVASMVEAVMVEEEAAQAAEVEETMVALGEAMAAVAGATRAVVRLALAAKVDLAAVATTEAGAKGMHSTHLPFQLVRCAGASSMHQIQQTHHPIRVAWQTVPQILVWRVRGRHHASSVAYQAFCRGSDPALRPTGSRWAGE